MDEEFFAFPADLSQTQPVQPMVSPNQQNSPAQASNRITSSLFPTRLPPGCLKTGLLFLLLVCFLFLLFWFPCSLSASEAAQDPHSLSHSLQPRSTELELTPEEQEFLRSNPVIRVGNEDDWPPFDFSEHGVPQGYAIDHLELLGQKLGISFEYINGHTWSELLNLFREGKIDLLPSLWISESRKQYMLFTEPFLELPYVIVSSKQEDSTDSLQDLKGMTVAAPRGYVQEEVLRESFPEIQLQHVDNPLQGLKAVAYGQAQAYIGYRGVVDYLIATNFFTDLDIKGEVQAPELAPQGLYIAVQPDMPILRDLLQKAMDQVSRKQKVEPGSGRKRGVRHHPLHIQFIPAPKQPDLLPALPPVGARDGHPGRRTLHL